MDVLDNIQRTGRWLVIACTVAQVVVGFGAVFGLVSSALCALGAPVPTRFLSEATNNGIFEILVRDDLLMSLLAGNRLAVKALTFGITHVFLFAIVSIAKHYLVDISRGGLLFRSDIAKSLHHLRWLTIPLILWNVIVAVSLFLVTNLISYIIEYGAYLQERADETNRIQEELVVQFAEITENKSGQTGQHIKRVSEYSRVIAEEMGIEPDRVEEIRLASTMHDVGKLLIPSEILDKPGRLTDEEFATIKMHSAYGGQLLDNVEGEVMVLSRKIAVDHHERWDGKGYNEGKAGEEISLEGRIVAVADVYDALTSRRSYKDAWDDREAYDEIVRCSGTQFDPAVVKAFQRRYEDINAIRQKFHD